MAAKTPDWNALKTEYVTTRISQRELSKKYRVPYTTLQPHATADKWVEARSQYRAKVGARAIEAAGEKAAQYKSKIYDLAYKVAGQLEGILDSGNIVKMGLKPRDVTGALKDIADILAIKSEADAREQEARIKKLENDAQREDAGGKEIVVRIEGGEREWSE